MFEIKRVVYKFNDTDFDIESMEQFITEIVGSLQNDPINSEKIEKLTAAHKALKYMKSFWVWKTIYGDDIRCTINSVNSVPGLESYSYDIKPAGGGAARGKVGVDPSRIEDEKRVIPIFATVWEFSEQPGEYDEYYDNEEYDYGTEVETKFKIGEYDPSSMTLTLYSKPEEV
jgi:hypothetical protein